MNRQDIIEAMARAIHDNDSGLKADTIWDDLFHSTRKLYLEQAEAALDAFLDGLENYCNHEREAKPDDFREILEMRKTNEIAAESVKIYCRLNKKQPSESQIFRMKEVVEYIIDRITSEPKKDWEKAIELSVNYPEYSKKLAFKKEAQKPKKQTLLDFINNNYLTYSSDGNLNLQEAVNLISHYLELQNQS